MNYTKFSINPEVALRIASHSPKRIVSFMKQSIGYYVSTTGTSGLAVLADWNRDLPHRFSPVGFCQLGEWRFRGSRVLNQGDPTILVHWPTLVRNAADLFVKDHLAAIFVYSFIEVFTKKSPLLGALLHCKYVSELVKYQHISAQSSFSGSLPPRELSGEEEILLSELLSAASHDEDFLDTLKVVYQMHYQQHTRRHRAVPSLLSKAEYIHSSLLPFSTWNHANTRDCLSRVCLTDDMLARSIRCSERVHSFFSELMTAYEVSEVHPEAMRDPAWQTNYAQRAVTFGTIQAKQLSGEVVMFINWDIWCKYQMTWPHTYRRYDLWLKKYLQEARRDGRAVHYPELLGKYVWRAHKSCVVPVSSCTRVGSLPKIWKDVWDTDRVTAISVSKLLFRQRQTAAAIHRMKTMPYIIRNSKPRKRVTLLYNFPVQTDHATYTVQVACAWSKMYFKFPDTIVPRALLECSSDATTVGYLVTDDHEYYYSLKTLEYYKLLPNDPVLVHELVSFTKNVTRNVLRKLMGVGMFLQRYTGEMDRAIIRLMRPNMSEEQKQELIEICGHRPWRLLVSRASVLRKRLIDQGVFDVSLLPGLQYNHHTGQLIRKKKSEMQKRRGRDYADSIHN